jgi:hypothetical protein
LITLDHFHHGVGNSVSFVETNTLDMHLLSLHVIFLSKLLLVDFHYRKQGFCEPHAPLTTSLPFDKITGDIDEWGVIGEKQCLQPMSLKTELPIF